MPSTRDYPHSHQTMCNGYGGSCFTPWCTCECHRWAAEQTVAHDAGRAQASLAAVAREEAIDIVDRHTRLGGTGKPRSAASAVDALLAWGWTPPASPDRNPAGSGSKS